MAKTARIQALTSDTFKYTLDVYAATNRTTVSELIINGLLETIPGLREVYEAYDTESTATEDTDPVRERTSDTKTAGKEV